MRKRRSKTQLERVSPGVGYLTPGICWLAASSLLAVSEEKSFSRQACLWRHLGVTCRFVKNRTLRRGRGLYAKAVRSGRDFRFRRPAITAPVVVAGQVDVFPFQLELHGYSKPIAVGPTPGDKVAIGRREGNRTSQVHRD